MHTLNISSAILLCTLLGGTLLAGNSLFVSDESERIYGRGVHAFFDRNYELAITILSQAEEIDTEDPRPFYFLGLAHLRQDETELAEQYFRKAAQLEFGGRALRNYPVSESLRRIQGEERVRIENIRTEERTNARMMEQRLREARYGTGNTAAREALLQSLQQTPRNNVPAVAENVLDNPFGVRPVDPTRSPEEGITVQVVTGTPFGVIEESEAPDTGSDWLAAFAAREAAVAAEAAREARAREAAARAAARESDGFSFAEGFAFITEGFVPAMGDAEDILIAPIRLISPQGMVGTMTNAPPEIQTEAGRQAGRALGAWITGR